MPFEHPAIGRGKPHRPQVHDALPIDGGVEGRHREFAGQVARDRRRHQVDLAVILELDDCEASRYSGFGCTRTKSWGLGLRTGTVVRSFLTPAVSTND